MNIRDIAELIYFVSGPAVVIVGLLALNQIKVTKEQIKAAREISEIQSKRDALRVTSEQVRHYFCDVIPLISSLDTKIETKGIKFFKEAEVTIKNETIEVKPFLEKEDLEKMIGIVSELTAALNAIEGFSIYFISGVANEETAFRSMSSTFCQTVREYLPFYISYVPDKHAFEATLRLFMLWNGRLEHEQLLKDKEKIERQLRTKNKRTIKPIGVNA